MEYYRNKGHMHKVFWAGKGQSAKRRNQQKPAYQDDDVKDGSVLLGCHRVVVVERKRPSETLRVHTL